jgi:hypothetical protein
MCKTNVKKGILCSILPLKQAHCNKRDLTAQHVYSTAAKNQLTTERIKLFADFSVLKTGGFLDPPQRFK